MRFPENGCESSNVPPLFQSISFPANDGAYPHTWRPGAAVQAQLGLFPRSSKVLKAHAPQPGSETVECIYVSIKLIEMSVRFDERKGGFALDNLAMVLRVSTSVEQGCLKPLKVAPLVPNCRALFCHPSPRSEMTSWRGKSGGSMAG